MLKDIFLALLALWCIGALGPLGLVIALALFIYIVKRDRKKS